jgi:hypothetical protein
MYQKYTFNNSGQIFLIIKIQSPAVLHLASLSNNINQPPNSLKIKKSFNHYLAWLNKPFNFCRISSSAMFGAEMQFPLSGGFKERITPKNTAFFPLIEPF